MRQSAGSFRPRLSVLLGHHSRESRDGYYGQGTLTLHSRFGPCWQNGIGITTYYVCTTTGNTECVLDGHAGKQIGRQSWGPLVV